MWNPKGKDPQVSLFSDGRGAKQNTPSMGNVLGLPPVDPSKPGLLRYYEVEVLDNRGVSSWFRQGLTLQGIHVGWVREDHTKNWQGAKPMGIGGYAGNLALKCTF